MIIPKKILCQSIQILFRNNIITLRLYICEQYFNKYCYVVVTYIYNCLFIDCYCLFIFHINILVIMPFCILIIKVKTIHWRFMTNKRVAILNNVLFPACLLVVTKNNSAVVELRGNHTFHVDVIEYGCGQDTHVNWAGPQGTEVGTEQDLDLTYVKMADSGLYK